VLRKQLVLAVKGRGDKRKSWAENMFTVSCVNTNKHKQTLRVAKVISFVQTQWNLALWALPNDPEVGKVF
jgi:hypothetical protein